MAVANVFTEERDVFKSNYKSDFEATGGRNASVVKVMRLSANLALKDGTPS
jgi:hypothetical protein